jgi:hypothetical protein
MIENGMVRLSASVARTDDVSYHLEVEVCMRTTDHGRPEPEDLGQNSAEKRVEEKEEPRAPRRPGEDLDFVSLCCIGSSHVGVITNKHMFVRE